VGHGHDRVLMPRADVFEGLGESLLHLLVALVLAVEGKQLAEGRVILIVDLVHREGEHVRRGQRLTS